MPGAGDVFFLLASAALPCLLGAATWALLRRRAQGPSEPQGSDEPGWALLLAGNALVLLGLLAFVHVAAEGYYRLVYDTTDGNVSTLVSQRWFARYWRVNPQGFRDDVDYTPTLPSEKRRVTFLGDSFTTGHGVADVGARFASRVRRARPGWDVQVLALNGANTPSQLLGFQRYVESDWDFDLVVLVYTANDIVPLLPDLGEALAVAARRAAHPPWLLRHGFALNTWYYRWLRSRDTGVLEGTPYVEHLRRAYAGEPWQQQRQLLAELDASVRQAGARLAVMVFPWMPGLADGDDPLVVMHERLAEFCRTRDVPHLDLGPVLRAHHHPDALVVNAQDAHPGPLAHALVADALLPWLDGLLASPRAAGAPGPASAPAR